MTQELIISISGMRGLIGQNMFPETAAAYGAAFATFLRKHYQDRESITVAVGRDSRPSGQMVFSAVASGLTACGVDVIDLGICSTPGVGVALREHHCAGGVVITASHNPTPYNGIKFLLDNGIAPPKPMAEQIIEIYRQNQVAYTDATQCGSILVDDQTVQLHTGKVLEIVRKETIAARRLKVVLDSVNGAGGPEGIVLLESLGCEVIRMNTETTGLFAHTPEPTAENLTSLCDTVKAANADLGFAQDPDADRLAIVDEHGTYIGEEYSLALAAMYIFSHQSGTAAANLSTSRMIDDIAAKAGGSVIRTPVGEAHVANAMVANQCIIGGEGNGGIIDLRVGPIRDSLVGMALTLQLMAETGKRISELVSEIGSYSMFKTKYPADKRQAAAIIDKAKGLFSNAVINDSDGCRFDLPDGWIHIRTSNTEPIMRVIIEAQNPESARQYIQHVGSICREILNP